MEPRMQHPALLIPDVMPTLLAFSHSTKTSALPPRTMQLVHLRASQINGCTVCVDMHARDLKKLGETDQRLHSVAAWRDAPWFSGAERAALELTEAVTRLADYPDPVPDELWEDVSQHYDHPTLAALLVQISVINVWNRLNVATRQVPVASD